MSIISELIVREKVIVIVRRCYGADLVNLTKAMGDAGLHLLELTFDQSDPDCLRKTADSIAMLRKEFGGSMHFGAGTVLTKEQVQAACDVGCEFIISPNVNPAVIQKTKELGLVSIPGAMTPTEILFAHDCGADFVKVFPAGYLGVSYFKDIMAPISHVKLIATAGITEENFADFLKRGVVAAGISGRLTDKALIAEGNFAELTARAKAFKAISQNS